MRASPTVPDGFEHSRDGRIELVVRRDAAAWLAPLLRDAPAGWPGGQAHFRRGGRGEVAILQREGHQCLVRTYRRGGLPALLLRTLYFGRQPRPFAELTVTEALRQRGVPVVEVLGAAVQWLVRGCYRGWLATCYIPDAKTLWLWAQQVSDDDLRFDAFRRVGQAIRKLHDAGGRHPDLNLNNILVWNDGATAQVCLIDFDRARLDDRRPADADLARLQRSADKIDPQRVRLRDIDLETIRRAYNEAGR